MLSTKIWLWALLVAFGTGGFVGLLGLVGPENFDLAFAENRVHSGVIGGSVSSGHAVVGMVQGLLRKASRRAVKTAAPWALAVAM